MTNTTAAFPKVTAVAPSARGHIDCAHRLHYDPIPVEHLAEDTHAQTSLIRYADNDPHFPEPLLDYYVEVAFGNSEHILQLTPTDAVHLGQTLLAAGVAAQIDRAENKDFFDTSAEKMRTR